jgi:UNC-50 family
MSSASVPAICVLTLMPGRRYRHTSYHKQTKNQWARDDPAFIVVTAALLAAAALAHCIACVTAPSPGPSQVHALDSAVHLLCCNKCLVSPDDLAGLDETNHNMRAKWELTRGLACCRFGHGLWNSVITTLSAIFVDFLGIGVLFATACWCVSLAPKIACMTKLSWGADCDITAERAGC